MGFCWQFLQYCSVVRFEGSACFKSTGIVSTIAKLKLNIWTNCAEVGIKFCRMSDMSALFLLSMLSTLISACFTGCCALLYDQLIAPGMKIAKVFCTEWKFNIAFFFVKKTSFRAGIRLSNLPRPGSFKFVVIFLRNFPYTWIVRNRQNATVPSFKFHSFGADEKKLRCICHTGKFGYTVGEGFCYCR